MVPEPEPSWVRKFFVQKGKDVEIEEIKLPEVLADHLVIVGRHVI